MSFDFQAAQKALVTTFEYDVLDPFTREPSGWVWTLTTAAHPESMKKVRKVIDRMRSRRGVSTPEQDDRDGAEMLAARVLGWTGLIENGEPVEYTPQKAMAYLSEPTAFWLLEQISEALGDSGRPFVQKKPSDS